LLTDIERSFEDFNITLDFEGLYSILEGLDDPFESARSAGPLAAYFIRERSRLPKKYDYSEILEDLKKIIYEKCSIKQDMVKKITKVYDELFQIANYNEHTYLFDSSTRASHSVTKIVATTNYDMVMELYFMSKNRAFGDGFSAAGNLFIKTFSEQLLLDPLSNSFNNFLLKLHGSIWQFQRPDSIIKTNVDPITQSPIPINIGKEMMIYPTKEKDILNYLYFPFFMAFKRIRWNRLIVIGYSFRDDPINKAIIENMQIMPKSKLVVINPNPSNVLKNLNFNLPGDRVIEVSGKFGESSTINDLNNAGWR